MNGIEETAARLRTVVRLLKRKSDALRDLDSPSHSEQAVMVWLDEKGAMSPRALAEAQQVRPQTVQQTLDSLERRGLARRSDHPTDRRQILISLTAKGRRVLARGRGRRQAWLVGELRKLSPRERATVAAALGIIEGFLEQPNQPKSK